MKICNYEFVILVLLMFIIVYLYDQLKTIFTNEGFQNLAQVANADLNMLRNIFGIASSNSNSLNIGTKLNVANDVSISGRVAIGSSFDGVSNTITDSVWDNNSLCIVGQGVYPNRKIHLWDSVVVDQGLSVNGLINSASSINIGDPNLPSGSSKTSATANNKILTFDNSFNGTPGQGIPANKIRLHNNNNAWIGGFGLEGNAVAYNSGCSHRFYVNSGANYGDLALDIDNSKNITMKGDLYVKNNVILDGDNKWILHTPDDGRKTMYVAPWNGKDNWDWGSQVSINNDGTLNAKQIKIGSWLIRDGNGHLQFIKDGTTYNDDYGKIPKDSGFLAMAQDGNIWLSRYSEGWIADYVKK